MARALVKTIDFGTIIATTFLVLKALAVAHGIVLYAFSHRLILGIGTVVLASEIRTVWPRIRKVRVTQTGRILLVALAMLTAVHRLLLLYGVNINVH